MFQRILSPQSLGLKIRSSKKPGEARLVYSSVLKMEALCSLKMLGSLQTTGRYNTEVHALNSHCHENLNYNKVVIIFLFPLFMLTSCPPHALYLVTLIILDEGEGDERDL
jgi:hypothetical protein